MSEVSGDLRLMNIEYYSWLHCMGGHRKSDMKPDLFSAYHPLIEYLPPYENAPNCKCNRIFGKFFSWESHGKWNIKWEVRREMQVSSDSIYSNSSFPKQLRSIASYRISWWKHFVFYFQYNKHYLADLVVGCMLYYVWGASFKLFGDIIEEIDILELEVVRKQLLT